MCVFIKKAVKVCLFKMFTHTTFWCFQRCCATRERAPSHSPSPPYYAVPFYAVLDGQVRADAPGSPGVPFVRVCATPQAEMDIKTLEPEICGDGANLAASQLVVSDSKSHTSWAITDNENDLTEPTLKLAHEDYATIKLANYANVTEVHVCGNWWTRPEAVVHVRVSDTDPVDLGAGKYGPECYDDEGLTPVRPGRGRRVGRTVLQVEYPVRLVVDPEEQSVDPVVVCSSSSSG